VQAKTGAVGISFVDDISWIATGKNVTEIVQILEQCAKVYKAWVRRNMVEFDVSKTEAILFAQKNHRRRLPMKINLGNGTKIVFNKGGTRWNSGISLVVDFAGRGSRWPWILLAVDLVGRGYVHSQSC
jgi:thiamine biosynthesis protein ThiC